MSHGALCRDSFSAATEALRQYGARVAKAVASGQIPAPSQHPSPRVRAFMDAITARIVSAHRARTASKQHAPSTPPHAADGDSSPETKGPQLPLGKTTNETKAPQPLPGKTTTGTKAPQPQPGKTTNDTKAPQLLPGKTTKVSKGPQLSPGKTTTDTKAPQPLPGKTMKVSKGPQLSPGKTTNETKAPQPLPGKTTTGTKAPQPQPGKTTNETKGCQHQAVSKRDHHDESCSAKAGEGGSTKRTLQSAMGARGLPPEFFPTRCRISLHVSCSCFVCTIEKHRLACMLLICTIKPLTCALQLLVRAFPEILDFCHCHMPFSLHDCVQHQAVKLHCESVVFRFACP